MKVTTRNRKYHFSNTFKIGSILIMAFSAIGIALSICLFMFGMAWIFMGALDKAANSSKITWGVVMICLGSYLVFVNAFTLALTCMAINKRSAKGALLLAIFSIAAIAPMFGGITLLFTPFDAINDSNNKNKNTDNQMILNSHKDHSLSSEELKEKEEMTRRLKSLKLRIDQNIATTDEEEEFELLLEEYHSRFN